MAKQALLFDSHYMAFKTIQLEVANKKPLTTKPTITQIEISCFKCIIFMLQNYVLHMENVVPCVENHMKLVLNFSI